MSSPQPDYIDGSTPAEPSKGARKVVIPAVAALSVLAVAGVGFAAIKLAGANGPQPDEYVPSSAFVYASVDLDPSAKEKVDAYRFLSKFKGLDLTDADKLRERLGAEAGEDAAWIGDRVAVAAIPNPKAEAGVTPFVIAQYSDEKAMRATLDKVADGKGTSYEILDENFAVIADTDEDVAAVVAALDKGNLAETENYTEDVDTLAGDRFGTIWIDVEAAGDLATDVAASTGEMTGMESLAEASGTLVAALEFSSDKVELTGTSTVSAAGMTTLSDAPAQKVSQLPAATDVAVGVTGLGDSLSKVWGQLAADGNDTFGLVDGAESMGLSMPADILAVFGTDLAAGAEITAAADDIDGVSVLVTTDGAARVAELAETLDAEMMGVTVAEGDGEYAATYGNPTDGTLGDTEVFDRAVDGDPNAVLFLNVEALSALWDNDETDADAKAVYNEIEAASVFTENDGESIDFTLRVTAP